MMGFNMKPPALIGKFINDSISKREIMLMRIPGGKLEDGTNKLVIGNVTKDHELRLTRGAPILPWKEKGKYAISFFAGESDFRDGKLEIDKDRFEDASIDRSNGKNLRNTKDIARIS